MMKQPLNEQFRKMQKLAGINENIESGIYKDIEDDLMNGEFESEQEQIEYLQGIIDFCQKQIEKLAGLNEPKFYSRDYVKQKYGNKAKEIEANIEDEEDNNPNIFDLYTSLETAEETDDFVKGFIND